MTEEQRRERLRISREKYRAKRTKKLQEEEEKVVASKQLEFAMETGAERRANKE